MSDKKLNLHPHRHSINRRSREKLHGHRSAVLWFTGLSGSGKSTIANLVEQLLYERGCSTYLLDGDNVRSGLNSNLDFSEAGREENIRRVAEVAKLFLDSGKIVLAAFVSPFEKDRKMAIEIIGREDFVEVFVDASLETCEKRDVKGLYKMARAGLIKDFTGIQSPFEAPDSPDIHLETDNASPEELALEVVKTIEYLYNS